MILVSIDIDIKLRVSISVDDTKRRHSRMIITLGCGLHSNIFHNKNNFASLGAIPSTAKKILIFFSFSFLPTGQQP